MMMIIRNDRANIYVTCKPEEEEEEEEGEQKQMALKNKYLK